MSPSLPSTLPLKAPLPTRFHGRRVPGQTVPLILYLHGGAFVSGSLDSGSAIAQLMADAGAVVMSIDYPLAPEHPFPQAIEAGHGALLWAHRHRTRLAGPHAPVFIAGEEAGGNLAAAIALMSRDSGQPPLDGQILLSPMLNPCLGTASLRAADAGTSDCRWAQGWRQYLSRASDNSHPYAAPSTALRLGALPATLLITAQDDPMKDETHAYAKRLHMAGVAVQEVVLPSPTGWPCSCQTPDNHQAPWAQAVKDHIQRFIHLPSPSSRRTS